MNTRDNDKIRDALGSDLPEHFRYDGYDFVDWKNPHNEGGWRDLGFARVIRVWGKDRVLVLFDDDDPDIPEISKGSHRATNKDHYRLLFLNTDNDLVEFSPHDIENQWRLDNGKDAYSLVPNRVVEDWLREHGARSFTGRGWVEDITMKIQNLVRRWEGHYNSNLFRVGK